MDPHFHSFRIEKRPCRIDLPPYAKATVDAHFRMEWAAIALEEANWKTYLPSIYRFA